MQTSELAQKILSFQEELRGEILRQSQLINESSMDGDLQDGFTMYAIEDGWIRYKGYAWGHVFHFDTHCLDMTFGPDWPFVGHRIMLKAEANGAKLVWTSTDNSGMKFSNAEQLANYGLQRLASKAGDNEAFADTSLLISQDMAAEN